MTFDVQRCKNCSLPTNFPGIKFDAEGVCSICQQFDKKSYLKDIASAHDQLIQTISYVKEVGKKKLSAYDAVVALSGGKDSCFTLKYLVEKHKLKCIAITVDNGFLSEQSIVNSQLLCDALGVDFLLWKPKTSLMKALYVNSLDGENKNKGSIVRASDLCSGCINLINSIMLKEAVARNIPLIAGGYIAGQVPKGTCTMKLRLETLVTFSKIKDSSTNKIFSLQHYKLQAQDLEHYSVGDSVHILNPMLSLTYNEEEILKTLNEMGWKRPKDTGKHSSNCQINDLGIKAHIEKYGFHPYEQEVAEQVRSGTLDRMEAIKKIKEPLDDKRISAVEAIVRSSG